MPYVRSCTLPYGRGLPGQARGRRKRERAAADVAAVGPRCVSVPRAHRRGPLSRRGQRPPGARGGRRRRTRGPGSDNHAANVFPFPPCQLLLQAPRARPSDARVLQTMDHVARHGPAAVVKLLLPRVAAIPLPGHAVHPMGWRYPHRPTPLALAALGGQRDVCRLLVRARAAPLPVNWPTCQDGGGRLPHRRKRAGASLPV